MPRRIVLLLSVLAAPCTAFAQTAARPAASPQPAALLDAGHSAIETCISGVTTGKMAPSVDVETFVRNAPPGFGTFKALADLPPLLKRFVATSGGGITPDFVMRFPTTEGQIWAIVRGSAGSCDLAFTGFNDAQVEPQVARLFSGGQGWTTAAQRPASAAAPMAYYLFAKRLPTPAAPAFGVRARMRGVGTTASTAQGIQLEINFIAGDLVLSGQSVPPRPNR